MARDFISSDIFFSTAMLSYWLFTGTSYALLLLWLFLWFVATMHFCLCFWKRITKRHIRYGEYTYLLLAIGGVFLASVSAGKDRLQLILTYKSQIQISENGVTNVLSLNERICDGALYQWEISQTEWLSRVRMEWLIRRMYVPSKAFCTWSVEASRLLKSSQPSAEVLSTIVDNGYKLADDNDWYSRNPFMKAFHILNGGIEQFLGPVTMLAIEAYSLRTYPAYSAQAMEEFQKQSHAILWDAIKSFLWPILLCFALSIRITKVTSDFFNWPR